MLALFLFTVTGTVCSISVCFAGLSDGLVAYWDFDDCTPDYDGTDNGTVADNNNNGFDGEKIGRDGHFPPQCTLDTINDTNAYYFDGDNYIHVNKNTRLSDPAVYGNEGLSLMTWAKPTACDNTAGHYMITTGGYVPALDPAVWYNVHWTSYSLIYNHSAVYEEDRRFAFELKRSQDYTSNGDPGPYHYNEWIFSDEHPVDEWYCVVATWDYASMTMKLYVDGIHEGTGTYTGPPAPETALTQEQDGIYIGRYTWNFNAPYDTGRRDYIGGLDEIRIYDRALTHEEIRDLCERHVLIELSSFTAEPGNAMVNIQWTTEAEVDNAGFNLYRSESEKGEYIKINDHMIPAEGFPAEGAFYEFTDTDVHNRKTYYYKLEDMSLSGEAAAHGPISAMPRLVHAILR